MVELIVAIIFFVSLAVLFFFLYRKAPVLAKLPQNGKMFDEKVVLKFENKIKDIYLVFKKQIILHKFLSWVKVLTLKVETRVDHLLRQIRKKAQLADKNTKKR